MIGLVSCSSQKLGRPAPARELYCSALFRKSLAYAEQRCERVYVLSALHHVVELDAIIEPYEHRLGGTRADGDRWASVVAVTLGARHRGAGCEFLVLAGADYARPLIRAIAHWWPDRAWRGHIELPLDGMQVGQRLRWLNEQLARSAA